jgi:predicted RNase H-like HicB family nuclease
MNKLRRLELRKIIRTINNARNDSDLDNCINTLDGILWDEQNYYDNIPENLQYSERATTSEEAIENIEEALEYLNEAISCEDKYEFMNDIKKAIDCIDSAIL